METPNSIDADLKLADVFRLKGDYRNAIDTVQKAALRQPKDSRPPAILTFLLDVENRKQEAKVQARRALALSPADPGSMNNLAYMLAETGDNLDEALRLARQAVKSAPEHPYFADTLGFVYLKRDQNNDAMEIFNNLVRKYPLDASFAYHMGVTWYQKGDREKAKTELTRAVQLGPSKAIETEINDLLSHIN
jgi:Flp pilus assembly protein TadD